MEHSLKTWPHEFDAIASGQKTFEARSTKDRSFGVGDILLLRKWDPSASNGFSRVGGYVKPGSDGGWHLWKERDAATIRAEVTYVLHGGRFGLPEDMCVMSIRVLTTLVATESL